MTYASWRRIRTLLFFSIVATGLSELVALYRQFGLLALGHAVMAVWPLCVATWMVMARKVQREQDLQAQIMIAATEALTAERMKRVHPLARKDPRLEQARNN